MIQNLKETYKDRDWLWPLTGAIVLWFLIGILKSNFNISTLFANGVSASFLAVAALGQMLVITTGEGAIDLSIPSVITFAAYLCTGIIGGDEGNFLFAILIVLMIGALIGLINSITVVYLEMPPIISTLAVGNIVTTATLLYNAKIKTFEVSSLLESFTKNKLFKIPIVIYFLIIIAYVFYFLIKRTIYGRSLIAVGQSRKAAYLAGVKSNLTIILAYIISGIMASLTGILLSGYVGGAFLDMGNPYLIQTIGSVVIGGTLIFGGKPVTIGTIFGSLFLILLVSTMQVAGFPIGIQKILEGLLIIGVLVIATNPRKKD